MSKKRKKNSVKRTRKPRLNPAIAKHQKQKHQMTLDAAERERLDAIISDFEAKQKETIYEAR